MCDMCHLGRDIGGVISDVRRVMRRDVLSNSISLPSYFTRSFPTFCFTLLPLFSQLPSPCFLVLGAQLGFPTA